MAHGTFSLSVSSRGNDISIGGAGLLDAAGIATLRQAVEDGCSTEGASVFLDLTGVAEVHPEAIQALVDLGVFCRDRGIVFGASFTAEVVRLLDDAGYDAELLPKKP